jgi:hypothetical protein
LTDFLKNLRKKTEPQRNLVGKNKNIVGTKQAALYLGA